MTVPFIDLARQDPRKTRAVEEAVLRVLDHRKFILGPEVDRFEETMGAFLDGAHVIGTSSGTDSLLAGLMALGVGAGDRVLTTPFSFFATAGTIARLGARPIFMDLAPGTFGMDFARLSEVDTRRLKAVIPVHLFGDTMDLEPLENWVGDDIPVFEDAAQAIGARTSRGAAAGTEGALGAFSFFPTKNLAALGDAGMIATRDPDLADTVRRLRAHGDRGGYEHVIVGGNFRLDAIQAAALAASLPFLEEETGIRRSNALGYEERFRALEADPALLKLPDIHERHTCHQYVVRVGGGRRDAVLAGLQERGIGAGVYYPRPFHLQPCFEWLGYQEGDFPESEKACEEVLALPIFPGLGPSEQDEVVEALMDLLG